MKSTASLLCLNYSDLLANYEKNMLDKLRNFSADHDVLDTWVPSNNFAQSILSLIESVWLSEHEKFKLQLSNEEIQKSDINILFDTCGVIADIHVAESSNGLQLTIEKKHQQAVTKERIARTIYNQAQNSYRTDERSTINLATLENYYLRAVDNYRKKMVAPNIENDIDGISISAHEGETSLTVVVNQKTNQVLQVVAHSDDAKQNKIVCAFSSILVGLPIREAVDHGAMHFLSVLTKCSDEKPPVSGIISCSSVPVVFAIIQKLMIQIGNKYQRINPNLFSGYNEFDKQPASKWRDLDKSRQLKHIQQAIAKYTAKMALPAGDIQVLDIEYEVRILIGFTGDLMTPAFDKGEFLMALEGFFRQTIESRLEVYMEPRRDQSKLRRLT